MAINIDKKYVKQVNSIMSKLPQNPFIIDVVGKAIEISYKNVNIEKDFETTLKLAGEAVEYVSATSSPTSYKYSIIASILLAGIDHTEYEVIDTVSGTVRDYVETFSQFMFADGYKEKWIALNNLVKKDSDLLYAALLVMVNDVETALKCEEPSDATKYLLAGMAYIEVSLRKSAITVPNRQYELYNRFMALLMRNAKF